MKRKQGDDSNDMSEESSRPTSVQRKIQHLRNEMINYDLH